MGEITHIAWCHHTFNPWIGCNEVSPGCLHCYARQLAEARLGAQWGAQTPRNLTATSTWQLPFRWNRMAEREGQRHRVFCSSLADVFEDRRDLDEPREWLFRMIELTPWLDWLLLTKRPQNILKLTPGRWYRGAPPGLWLGATMEDGKRTRERAPELINAARALGVRVRFASCEPLLEDIADEMRPFLGERSWFGCGMGTQHPRLHRGKGPRGSDCPRDELHHHHDFGCVGINWVIVGGESGAKPRLFDVKWAQGLIADCRLTGVPLFMKQTGAWTNWRDHDGHDLGGAGLTPAESRAAGGASHPAGANVLDFPDFLRVRQFPTDVAQAA